MGLYLMEEARKGTWIARYNGDPLTKKECDKRRRSQYKIQVHKNLFLDAENPCHFEGRFINDAKDSSAFKTNARFASNYAAMPPTHAQPLATPGCVSTQRGRSMQMKKFYWLWKRFLGQPRATNKDDTTIPDDYNHRFECNTTDHHHRHRPGQRPHSSRKMPPKAQAHKRSACELHDMDRTAACSLLPGDARACQQQIESTTGLWTTPTTHHTLPLKHLPHHINSLTQYHSLNEWKILL